MFRVQSFGFRVQGVGFRVQGLGFRVRERPECSLTSGVCGTIAPIVDPMLRLDRDATSSSACGDSCTAGRARAESGGATKQGTHPVIAFKVPVSAPTHEFTCSSFCTKCGVQLAT